MVDSFPTPRVLAIDDQRSREAERRDRWPSRRFEEPGTYEIQRLAQLVNVSRLMLVVEFGTDGATWTSRTTFWQAPGEASYMAANAGDPAPDDATLIAKGWRRVGGSVPEIDFPFLTGCMEHGLCAAASSAIEIDGAGWGVEGLVHLVPSANRWRLLHGLCREMPYRRLPCTGPAPIHLNGERREPDQAAPSTSSDE